MHPYVTDSDERKRIPLWLAFLSAIAAWVLHLLLQAIQFIPPWWSDIPSFAGFYYIFYTLFDKLLWRLPVLQRVGVIKVPNIAGKWEGYITSSFDEHKTQIKSTIQILQTWTELRIILETEKSISKSETASIITKTPNVAIVSYEYMNEPKAHAVATMHTHRGTARHTFQVANNYEVFDGEYYTGRGRVTFGALYFKRNQAVSQ